MKDNMAIACSGLCLVHCVITAALMGITAFGVMFSWLDTPWIHLVMMVPVIVLALLSLPFSFLTHRNYLPMSLVIMGISAMVATFFIPEHYEFWITIPAALLIIGGHYWNRQLIQGIPSEMEAING